MKRNIDINAYLDQDEKKDLLRLLTAGSVDDGKSTLIGRLLFDSKKIYEDQLSALERDSKRVGHAGEGIDYALLLDGLKAEREQGITIDVAYRYFSTNKRKFIIADTPGHEQYTRNMVTGASTANLAIILIDATKGVITQTRRHTFLVSLLGIKHLVLAVNKMDLVNYSREVFDDICSDYNKFIEQLDIPDVTFIPLSALEGENVVEPTVKMPWYHGKTMLGFLESVPINNDRNFTDMRFPVQYVMRPDSGFRGYSARIASGILVKGMTISVLPSRKMTRITNIVTYDGNLDKAYPPQSVTITLEDEIDISRGDMIVYVGKEPHVSRHIEAMLVWMGETHMDPSQQLFIKHANNTTRVRIDNIRYKIDVNTLEKSEIDHLELNEIGLASLTTSKPIFFDTYKENRNTGSFILIDPITNNTVAVGMITANLSEGNPYLRKVDDRSIELASARIKRGESLVTAEQRQERFNQKAATIYIAGLPGSGKMELALMLENELFNAGATVVLISARQNRAGLTDESSLSIAERDEQSRRVANICKMLNDQGIIAICPLILSTGYIREEIKQIVGDERFKLVYMDASPEYCKKNNPEVCAKYGDGLTFEVPGNSDLVLMPVNKANNVHLVLEYLMGQKIFPLI